MAQITAIEIIPWEPGQLGGAVTFDDGRVEMFPMEHPPTIREPRRIFAEADYPMVAEIIERYVAAGRTPEAERSLIDELARLQRRS